MSKRFTDGRKWRDPWYTDLPPLYKLLWDYLCDNCDNAGVWVVNAKLAHLEIGEEIDWVYALKAFGPSRVRTIADGQKWFIVRFIEFQYGELREKSPPHAFVLRLLRQHGLPSPVLVHRVSGGVSDGVSHTPKDKDKDKDMEKDSNAGARDPGDITSTMIEIPPQLRVVQNVRPPVSDLDHLANANAIVGAQERGAWQLLVDAHGLEKTLAAVAAVRAAGKKPFRSEVAAHLGHNPASPPGDEFVTIGGVRHKLVK